MTQGRCLDASVVLQIVFQGEPLRNQSRILIRESVRVGMVLIAPPFFVNEVDSVVRQRTYKGQLTPAEAQLAYTILDQTPVQIVSHPLLRQCARDIAQQFNQTTVYDSTYAALAKLYGYEFWTADKRFYNAVGTTLSFVKYLENYPEEANE